MQRHFNLHLEGLDIKFWHDLMTSRGELVTFRKGDYLCRSGMPTNLCGLVKSGYLIYSIFGETRVTGIGGFTFADALCGDYPNCMYNKPAVFDLVAGIKSEVWVIDATILPKLYKENIEYSEQGRLFQEAAYNSLLQRYRSICALTPTERYLELIKAHPQIEQDVPQIEIAKYLHITPIHLCRIRKALLNKPRPENPENNSLE